ncbi:MAG TPA: Ohr family peroxiredoxin [Nevskiaceae bacterium]|nr:Ohr family peroxiredoxin [Nevskiaceae bacterium]
MKTLYTAQVVVSSGRDGQARSSDGVLALPLGFPRELGGSGSATNPEQLFAAGYAACFASTLKAVAVQQQLKPGPVRIEAEATLAVDEQGRYRIPQVRLRIHELGVGAASAALIEAAKQVCAYTNATRGQVEALIEVLS